VDGDGWEYVYTIKSPGYLLYDIIRSAAYTRDVRQTRAVPPAWYPQNRTAWYNHTHVIYNPWANAAFGDYDRAGDAILEVYYPILKATKENYQIGPTDDMVAWSDAPFSPFLDVIADDRLPIPEYKPWDELSIYYGLFLGIPDSDPDRPERLAFFRLKRPTIRRMTFDWDELRYVVEEIPDSEAAQRDNERIVEYVKMRCAEIVAERANGAE